MAKPFLQKTLLKNNRKLFENPAFVHITLYTADYDHPRLTSRSFAMLPACCERRRLLRFETLFASLSTRYLRSLGEGPEISILGPVFIVFFRSGPPMMSRTCSDLLLDVHVALGTRSWFFAFFQGREKGLDRLRVTFYPGSPSLSLSFQFTYAVTYFDDFLASWTFLGFCFTHGAGWISHFSRI